MPVTQTALNVLSVWAPLYLDQATAKLSATVTRSATVLGSIRPPLAAELDRRLSGILRRKPARSREWQEYYNAACTFAVALGEWPVHPRCGAGGRGGPPAAGAARGRVRPSES